jgi:hypothetical protein
MNSIPENKKYIIPTIILTLVKLINEKEDLKLVEESIYIIYYLISNNLELQNITNETPIISILSSFILNKIIIENSLYCLSELCSFNEESRKQIIQFKILNSIIHFLNSNDSKLESIKIAILKFIKSLSRSIRNLRTNIIDSQIQIPLFNLINHNNLQIQENSIAILCNLVLEFSPIKNQLIQNGILNKIINKIKHVTLSNNIKFNYIFLLKNLIYMSDNQIKENLLKELTLSFLLNNLICDQNILIKEQSFILLRNLLFRHSDLFINYLTNEGFSFQFFINLLENNFINKMTKEIIYIFCNLSSNYSDLIKNQLINSSILNFIIDNLNNYNNELLIPSLWSLINLVYYDKSINIPINRIHKLKELGCQFKLQIISQKLDKFDFDIQDRIKSLKNLLLL